MRAPSSVWLLPGVCWVSCSLASLSTQIEVSMASYGSGANEPLTQALGQYFDPTLSSLWGLAVGAAGMMAFGALAASSGRSDGVTIMQPTARPRAGALYAAKATAVGVIAAIVGQAVSFTAFMKGWRAVSGYGLSISLAQPGVLRAVTGGGLFLALAAILGFGLGALQHAVAPVRSIWPPLAGAFVAWAVLIAIPDGIAAEQPTRVIRWLPGAAGTQIWHTKTLDPGAFTPWTGLGVFCGYTAIAVFTGLIAFAGRAPVSGTRPDRRRYGAGQDVGGDVGAAGHDDDCLTR
jgi:ABC-2 type transport system permease protein